jgi:geranylgeranyl pyrophosphate synthase/predicted secreted hydrolase
MTQRSPQRWPEDWPAPGPIDLDAHDPPHGSSSTEWWYVNAHVEAESGLKMAIFASFFRIAVGRDEHTREVRYAHSLTWAVSDLSGGRYLTCSRVDPDAPRLGLDKLDRGEGPADARLRRAMREVLDKGHVPWPDRLMTRYATVDARGLALDFDGDRFFKDDDGNYHVKVYDSLQKLGFALVFSPKVAPCRHGDDGVVKAVRGEDMFYYFIPRCDVRGEVILDGRHERLTTGLGWYDHEFGHHHAVTPPPSTSSVEALNKDHPSDDDTRDKASDIAWNWISAQLSDGSSVTAYVLHDVANDRPAGRWAVVLDADGNESRHQDCTLEPAGEWTSVRSFHSYPTRWKLDIPSAALSLDGAVAFGDQEFVTVLSKPAFWEGRVDVGGHRGGAAVTGKAYVERSGYSAIDNLDDFFRAVGREVRKSVASLLPFEMGEELLRDLVALPDRPDYIDGVDADRFVDTMVRPIRFIVDRGGKSWRSYAALCCCDVVGGDSRPFARWLAMPELMHSGSLIVDDVQDKSEVRRGGPTCHAIYGDAIAINAGTAAYFMGQKLLFSDDVSSDDRLRLYDLYFLALRAGHAGQALDLRGFDDLLDGIVEDGGADALEARILAVHRLKTAVPAASLARMGAVVGGGTRAQIEAVGGFFEAVGLAFQIVDDVLNLRGFAGDLKQRGEDLTQGKVTLPVARALALLERDQRRWLVGELRARTDEPLRVSAMVDVIEGCGALEACSQQARDLVEDGWRQLDSLVDDSLPKLMLRAFGWYVLERHY